MFNINLMFIIGNICSDLLNQRQILELGLNDGSLECAVCQDTTTNEHPIWNCPNCYNIFHLNCVIWWYMKSNQRK